MSELGRYLLSTCFFLQVRFKPLELERGIADSVCDTIVLPPIPTAHLTAADVEELTRTTREKMLKELVSLSESPMGRKAAKASVEAGEEDRARWATPTAMASGVER